MIREDLAREIERIFSKLEETEPGTDEYKKLKADLMDLQKLKLNEEESDCRIGMDDRKLELAEREFNHNIEKDLDNKEKEAKLKWYQKLDPNSLLSAGVSLFSIFAILNFERFGVVASKALGFITKPRIK